MQCGGEVGDEVESNRLSIQIAGHVDSAYSDIESATKYVWDNYIIRSIPIKQRHGQLDHQYYLVVYKATCQSPGHL